MSMHFDLPEPILKYNLMSESSYAIDTAARFGEIPFAEFATTLLTDIFDSITDNHIRQMEAYADLVNSISQGLSSYINNTVDGVDFEDIASFISGFELPRVDDKTLEIIMGRLEVPVQTANNAPPPPAPDAQEEKWWGALINAVAPLASDLIDKIKDSNAEPSMQAILDYNTQVTQTASATLPSFQEIYDSLAALMASNKYALLQTMVNKGRLMLKVDQGVIRTTINFSTHTDFEKSNEHKKNTKDISKLKQVKGGGFLFFKSKKKQRDRFLTVNTSKYSQKESNGTSVDITGFVQLNFSTVIG